MSGERVTREQQESMRCEVCGAEPGQPCFRCDESGWPIVRFVPLKRPHRERRQAYLDKQAGDAREEEHGR